MAEIDNNTAPVSADGVIETNPPKPPAQIIPFRVGEPSLPAMARGVIKDGMQKLAADNREHNCDICAGMNKDIALAKAEVMLFVGGLRKSIEALFAGTSTNPALEDIQQQIKAIKAQVKAIKKEIEPIQEQIKALQAYAKELQQLIQDIMNLPADLQRLFLGCLSEATASLNATVNEIKSIGTDAVKETIAAVVDPLKAEAQAISDAISASIDETPTP
jgi:prefoldin subunit 5